MFMMKKPISKSGGAIVLLLTIAVTMVLAVEPGTKESPDIEYGVAAGESLRLDAAAPAGNGPFKRSSRG